VKTKPKGIAALPCAGKPIEGEIVNPTCQQKVLLGKQSRDLRQRAKSAPSDKPSAQYHSRLHCCQQEGYDQGRQSLCPTPT